MATEYKTITDRVIAILEAEKTDSLSDDLSTNVVSISKGQYVPGSAAAKPCIYVRPESAGVILEMAGGQSRLERLMLLISGATISTDKGTAWDDAANLFNNIQNALMNYPTDSGYWGGSRFGWSWSDQEENVQPFGRFEEEPGTDKVIVHFWMRWSCDIVIGTETL